MWLYVELTRVRASKTYPHITWRLVFPRQPCTKGRATSHTRVRARDHYASSTLVGGKGGAGPSLLHTTLEGPKEYICECKMGVRVCMDSYMASNGSCFVITLILFKNHLLEVCLTQNRWNKTMALRTHKC
jgi:hypothetical protein